MKLRDEFSLVTGAILVIATVIFGAVAYNFQKSLVAQNFSDIQRTEIAAFSSVCRSAILAHNPQEMSDYATLLKQSHGIIYAFFVDRHSVIKVHSDPRYAGMRYTAWLKYKPANIQEVYGEVRIGRRQVGSAVIGYWDGYEKSQRRLMLWRTLTDIGTAAFLVALIGLLVIFIFADIITAPIRGLVRSMEEVGRGNFKAEIPSRGSDEIGSLAGRFNVMNRNLEAWAGLKDEFVSVVSHDLRNPLGAIKMYADYLADEDEHKDALYPNQKKILAVISDSAARLNVMVTNILDTAKIKAGRMEYFLQPTSLFQVAKDAQDLFSMVAGKKQISIENGISEQLPPVFVDPDRFRQVLANLLSNAVKFTETGGRITLDARIAAGAQMAELSVSNTGSGMSPEQVQGLFGKFNQMDGAEQSRRKISGTGLGLYIVKKTIEAMGGSVAAASVPNKETRFTVVVPIAKPGGSSNAT